VFKIHAPSLHSLFLTGTFCPLWELDAADDDVSLCVHLADPSLVRALLSPPAAHSNEVAEFLHERIRLPSTVITTYLSYSSPKDYSPRLISPYLGMFFAREYSCTGITSLQFQPGEGHVLFLCELNFQSLLILDCPPVRLDLA